MVWLSGDLKIWLWGVLVAEIASFSSFPSRLPFPPCAALPAVYSLRPAMTTFSTEDLAAVLRKHPQVPGASIALINGGKVQPVCTGFARVSAREAFTPNHFMQCASLSKTVAAAFAIDFFGERGIDMEASVNRLLQTYSSSWIIESRCGANADTVTLAMLVNHTALGMHYVYGIPLTEITPSPVELLDGRGAKYRYQPLFLERAPGSSFSYSGGGFVVLQHLIELMEQAPVEQVTRRYLDHCGLADFTFVQLHGPLQAKYAYGHLNPASEVAPLAFPPFAAGGLCTPTALATFLQNLTHAYHDPSGAGSISHRAARRMLGEATLQDLGAMDFMGAKIGLGVFVATAGPNKIMLHQAANDGFRGVYMLCFEGPDKGKGFVILSNGDNPAVLFQGELARLLLGPSGMLVRSLLGEALDSIRSSALLASQGVRL